MLLLPGPLLLLLLSPSPATTCVADDAPRRRRRRKRCCCCHVLLLLLHRQGARTTANLLCKGRCAITLACRIIIMLVPFAFLQCAHTTAARGVAVFVLAHAHNSNSEDEDVTRRDCYQEIKITLN